MTKCKVHYTKGAPSVAAEPLQQIAYRGGSAISLSEGISKGSSTKTFLRNVTIYPYIKHSTHILSSDVMFFFDDTI